MMLALAGSGRWFQVPGVIRQIISTRPFCLTMRGPGVPCLTRGGCVNVGSNLDGERTYNGFDFLYPYS